MDSVRATLDEGKLDVTGLPKDYSPTCLAVDTDCAQYLFAEHSEREEFALYVGDTSGLTQAQDFNLVEGSEVDVAEFRLNDGTPGKMILPRDGGKTKGAVVYPNKTLKLSLLWNNMPEMMSRLGDALSRLEEIMKKI